MPNKIIPYNPRLKTLARQLRKEMTKAEVLLWQELRKEEMGVQFHRQVPVLDFILDFYCHELLLAIEVDGITHTYEEMPEKDRLRDQKLSEWGIEVLRFDDAEVLKKRKAVINYIFEKTTELKNKYKID